MSRRVAAIKRSKRYIWIAVIAVLVLGVYYLFGKNDAQVESSLQPSVPPSDVTGAAPAFTLTDINGQQVSLADFRGKVVVLDFWATWCPPCRREIPDFIDLQKQYGSQEVQIVGIALDEPDKVKSFARDMKMNYPVLLGTPDIAMRYGGIDGIPTTFVIDRKGMIANRFEGFRPADVFDREIRKLLSVKS